MPVPEWVRRVVGELDGEAVLKKAVSRGGDLSDLYWEESSSTSLVLEDGRLEKVMNGLDAGASVRTVFDDHTAFASTNELTPERMLDLAGTVASAVDRGRPFELGDVKPGRIGPAFTARIPAGTVKTRDKVELMRRAEAEARSFDPRIRQVKV
ncbi:MAG: hypothetical protein KKB20_13685, partial [Proteobacteria bacterium]|nr:hypothetical protein [Pseudomonadota bacterium]